MSMHTGPPAVFGFVQSWFNDLPLLTRTLLTVMVSTHILRLLTSSGFGWECLSPVMVLQHLQVYRAFTAAFVHGGVLHLGFNMLAFVPLGTAMEKGGGTLQLAWLISIIGLLEAVLFVVFAYILQWTFIAGAAHQCAIGFSGIIFGLIVVETAQDGLGSRSIFGLFSVPSAYYPWVLLVLWQFLMPSVSFLGHLAGVLVGQLWVSGYLRMLHIPKARFQAVESSPYGAHFLRLHGFVLTPGGALPLHTANQVSHHSGGVFGPNIRQLVQRAWGTAAGPPHFADGEVSARGVGGSSGASRVANSSNSNSGGGGATSSTSVTSVAGGSGGTVLYLGIDVSKASAAFVGTGRQLDAGRTAPSVGSLAAAAAAAAEARAQAQRQAQAPV